MIEYSAKEALWDGTPDDDTILLHYPKDRNSQISLGITTRANDSISDLNTRNNTMTNHHDSTSGNMDDGFISSHCIIETDAIEADQ
jgi:hypothetical protein